VRWKAQAWAGKSANDRKHKQNKAKSTKLSEDKNGWEITWVAGKKRKKRVGLKGCAGQ